MDVQNPTRRSFLRRTSGGLAFGLTASSLVGAAPAVAPAAAPSSAPPSIGELSGRDRALPPILATRDRLIKENVGLRPFRKGGPNLGVERVGAKTIVHNYGHGGSGWSLSWGTAAEARDKALQTGAGEYAVIGCGAAGMTTAILLQRAGQAVTIYARERNPHITSTMATGVWSPDSRICLEERATPAFAEWWEKICRSSFEAYQHLLGLPGQPVEWVPSYAVSTRPWEELEAEKEAAPGPKFGHFRERVEDLTPRPFDLSPDAHPFSEPFARKSTGMVFNLPAYTDYLLDQFAREGGRIITREFHQPSDFTALQEDTIVNCTGLGAKALFGDSEMVPVWGQMSFLVPQPELRYSFSNEWAYAIPRRDGVAIAPLDNGRYGETEATPSRTQSHAAIDAIARSVAAMKR